MEQIILFDYAVLDTETRDVVQQRTAEIRGLVRRAAQDIIEIGARLIEVKDRLGHGRFGAWLTVEFGWTDRTALNMMRVADKFKSEKFSDLMAPSALYLLASPSTPEEARQEALERAEAGERITYSAARAIVDECRAEPDTANIGQRETPEPDPAPAALWTVPTPEGEPTDAAEAAFVREQILDAARAGYAIPVPPAEPVTPPPSMAIHYSSASPSWNTPRHIVDRVLAVLGEIDLDPCSNSHDAPNVPAFDHYTEEDDGLAHTWLGRVFMNPPYGDVIGSWVTHLLDDYTAGNVTEAIVLVPARTDTQWFAPLWDYPCCFVRGRLRFNDADPAPFPSVAVYLGPHANRFREVFDAIGAIVRRVTE